MLILSMRGRPSAAGLSEQLQINTGMRGGEWINILNTREQVTSNQRLTLGENIS